MTFHQRNWKVKTDAKISLSNTHNSRFQVPQRLEGTSWTATLIVLKKRTKLKAEIASTHHQAETDVWTSGGNVAHFSFYLLYALLWFLQLRSLSRRFSSSYWKPVSCWGLRELSIAAARRGSAQFMAQRTMTQIFYLYNFSVLKFSCELACERFTWMSRRWRKVLIASKSKRNLDSTLSAPIELSPRQTSLPSISDFCKHTFDGTDGKSIKKENFHIELLSQQPSQFSISHSPFWTQPRCCWIDKSSQRKAI